MLPEKQITRLSKLLSYILRHNPGEAGIELNNQGWAPVDQLLIYLNNKGEQISLDLLKHIAATNSKKRFSFNDDFTMIRASQGHSIEVDLDYAPSIPPDKLYHGTVKESAAIILEKGIAKMQRHHVHLSKDVETATQVGSRRGKPIILTINAKAMHEKGFLFYMSDNGVWLTDHVPPEFIELFGN
jgi:putative RNA 2'-phosphotransferase